LSKQVAGGVKMVVSWPNEETGEEVVVRAILMAKAQNIGSENAFAVGGCWAKYHDRQPSDNTGKPHLLSCSATLNVNIQWDG
jgi:hypothetical protein